MDHPLVPPTGLDPAGLALLARPKSDTESVLPLSGSTDE